MKVLPLFCLLLQSTPSPMTVEYSANRMVFYLEEERVVLSGATRVKYEEILVEADSVEYELASKEVRAYGSPVLYDHTDAVEGDSMRYSVETGEGTIAGGRTEVSKGFFEGQRIRKTGRRRLNVSEGMFTTCDLPHPHYSFRSSMMIIYLNDRVLCRPVVLYIQDIPVFAVPFWFFPIRKERHSGFLMPRIGTDSREGRYMKGLAYYLVINDYSDATVTLDYMQKVGFRLMAEGVYLVRPWVEGGVVASLLNDDKAGTRRWSVDLSHRQKWGDGYNLLLRGDFVSDQTYYREYSESLPERMTRTLQSYVSLSKSFRTASVSAVASETRDLDENTYTQTIPRLSYSLFSRELAKSIYFSSSGSALNRHSTGFDPVQNVQNTLKLSTKQRIGPLNVTPAVEHSELWKRDDRRSSTSRIRVGANTNVYGLFRKKIGPIDAMRHVISPSLNYQMAVNQQGTTQRLGFQVRNSVQLRLGSSSEYELLTATTGGSYDLDEERLSPLSTSVDINPVPPFNLSFDFSYEPHERKVSRFSQAFQTFFSRRGDERQRFDISLTQSYEKRESEDAEVQIWGQTSFNLTRKWLISYEGRYDLTRGKPVSHSLRVTRDLHCWIGEFSLNWTKVNWKYDFKIWIRGMPDITLKKGFFSIFLP